MSEPQEEFLSIQATMWFEGSPDTKHVAEVLAVVAFGLNLAERVIRGNGIKVSSSLHTEAPDENIPPYPPEETHE